MEYLTKRDYIDALDKILAPVRDALRKGVSMPSYGATAAWYDDISVGVEGFARPLWGLVPLWYGGHGDDGMKELYRRGIAAGTDPASGLYWGECGSCDQRYVEMASMAYGMLFTPEISLTGAQKTSTVTAAKGIAIRRMNGIRRPLGFCDLSDMFAIIGSVTASNTLPRAAMPPMTVAIPKITRPWGMNRV